MMELMDFITINKLYYLLFLCHCFHIFCQCLYDVNHKVTRRINGTGIRIKK